jgi:putative Mg2+ transporter-C (MgtC) family protein
MVGMPLNLGWPEIALRLFLTAVAGLLIGYNRTEHGKAAGLRTTLLVCLAASVAMIQVNLLLPMAGRSTDSFVMNDLMRLPLGILTGVGFIGGGAIIRRDDIVVGVTTAATLWCVTVIGLCFGGGQIALGIAATAIALAALWLLQWIEVRLGRERRACLYLVVEGDTLSEHTIREMIAQADLRITGARITASNCENHREFKFNLIEYRRPMDSRTPAIYERLLAEKGVLKLQWDRLSDASQ